MNPFLELRRRAGLSLTGWSRALGLSTSACWAAEQGLVEHPKALLDALRTAGFDVDELYRCYREWLFATREEAREALAARARQREAVRP